MSDGLTVPGRDNLPAVPPVLSGAHTPEIERRVENFFHSVASIFEAWVGRRKSDHTRRAYRGDVMAFVGFRGFVWPKDSAQLLRVSILDVQAFKDDMGKHGGAPKTINRRISSLSSFYKFLAGAVAEFRSPITVPNPAHAQFISRESSDPVDETRALSETRARQLMGMPTGDSLLDIRDRAILKFYLYTGARIDTGCKLNVSDFHQDGDEATLRFHIKGGRSKTKGIHFSATKAITEYVKAAGIESGPLFRARRSPHGKDLAARRDERAHYVPRVYELSGAPSRRDAGTRASRRDKDPEVHLFAALTAGDDGDIAARCRRADRIRPGSPRPQAHHHNADL